MTNAAKLWSSIQWKQEDHLNSYFNPNTLLVSGQDNSAFNMENMLSNYVSPEDLKKAEDNYQQNLKINNVTSKIQFEYGWCLIRSRYPADIIRGVVLLEDLFYHNGDEQAKRDYILYLAVGITKLKEYDKARRYVKSLLTVEPENKEAQELQKLIMDRMKKMGLLGLAIAGGVVLAVGGLVGISFAFSKKWIL